MSKKIYPEPMGGFESRIITGTPKAFSDVTMNDDLLDEELEREDQLSGWGKALPGSKGYQKCALSHKPLKIKNAIGEYTVYGGACGDPVHDNLDIYVALDWGTSHDPKAWPWNGTRQFVLFPITDMSVPKDAVEFRKMIGWLAEQIVMGKSVHVGCIGGHGRTGMVLAALVKVISGNEDAVTYVRDNYCQKAVERNEQIEFLAKHFGIKKVKAAKEFETSHKTGWLNKGSSKVASLVKEYGSNVIEVKPFRTVGNIWGILSEVFHD